MDGRIGAFACVREERSEFSVIENVLVPATGGSGVVVEGVREYTACMQRTSERVCAGVGTCGSGSTEKQEDAAGVARLEGRFPWEQRFVEDDIGHGGDTAGIAEEHVKSARCVE